MTTAGNPGLRQRILVVDDDKHYCEMLTAWLGARYELDFAHDGEEGVRRARQERPDLILLDVMMPKLSGFSLAWVFKHDPFFRGVPVIYCTAHAADWMNPEEALSKADAFLLKPFSLQQLGAMLDKQLAGASLAMEDFLQGRDGRAGPMYQVDLPCRIESEGADAAGARIEALAHWGGLLVMDHDEPALGSTVRLLLSDGDSNLRLASRLVCRQDRETGARVGVRFHFASVTQERAYQKLLARYGAPPPSSAGEPA